MSDGKCDDWDDERDRYLLIRSLELQRQGVLDRVPTDVRFIRYISPSERDRMYRQVLRGLGFELDDVNSDDATEWRIEDKQKPAAAAALYRCEVMYPVHPIYLQITEKLLRRTYEYYVEELVPCLVKRGYDPGPVPSLEFYEWNYRREYQWNPYSQIFSGVLTSLQVNERDKLFEECPPEPPLSRLLAEQ